MRVPVSILAVLLAAPLATTQSITTSFGPGSVSHTTRLATRPSVSLDIEVLNPAGIVIDRLDLHMPYQQRTGHVEVYMTDNAGRFSGNLVNPPPGMWKLRSRANFQSAGSNSVTPVTLERPIVLPPGIYGMTIVHYGNTARFYSISTNPPTQTVFSNGEVTLFTGARQNEAFVSVEAARVPSLTIYYNLLTTDIVDFTVDVREGPGPLMVNFMDTSHISSGAVQGYEWDFDNDGVPDAFSQNPPAVFANCGTLTPRLRVFTVNGPIDRVFNDLIVVDPLQASFTVQPDRGTPPLTGVQFTDTSSGNPAAWNWDFDGDGVVDSTAQNPVWNFEAGAHNVSLTVVNACRTSTVTERVTVTTDSWDMGYSSNGNFIQIRSMLTFDLAVTATEEIIIAGLDVDSLAPLGEPVEIEVWLTSDTWVGKHLQPDEWRLIAHGTAPGAGGSRPTKIQLDRPFILMPGVTYGMAVHYANSHPYYANPGSVQSNADFTLTPGAAIGTANGVFVNANLNQPRQWSGGFHYVRADQWPVGSLNWYASGCAGSLGVPRIEAAPGERMQIGRTTTTSITNLPQSSGILVFGTSRTMSAFGPLPFDLSVLGMTGCPLLASLDITVGLAGANNQVSFPLTLANSPSLLGIQLYLQMFAVDPAANSVGLITSDGAAVLTGY